MSLKFICDAPCMVWELGIGRAMQCIEVQPHAALDLCADVQPHAVFHLKVIFIIA